jgi:hypothetical protein
MIYFHKHHLIPKHAGGTNDPSNIIKVNTALHAFLHKQLYEEYGRWQDKIAYECLSGQISNEEATKQAQKHYMTNRVISDETRQKYAEATRKRLAEKGHPLQGKKFSEASKKKMSESHLGQKAWNKGLKMSAELVEANRQAQLKRPKVECPHCGRLISGQGNLKQHINSRHKEI